MSIFNLPMCNIKIEHDEHFVYASYFTTDQPLAYKDSKLYQLIKSEIYSYFQNPNHPFKVPLKYQGTPFQQRVCNALLDIPVGHTLTYGELSEKLNSSPRAIGQACKRNPIALFIPCHRVVSSTGLGGFMGAANALQYKSYLLQHEKHTDR